MNGGLINLNKGYTEAPIYTNVNKTNDLKSTNIDILAEDLMIKGNEKLIGNQDDNMQRDSTMVSGNGGARDTTMRYPTDGDNLFGRFTTFKQTNVI